MASDLDLGKDENTLVKFRDSSVKVRPRAVLTSDLAIGLSSLQLALGWLFLNIQRNKIFLLPRCSAHRLSSSSSSVLRCIFLAPHWTTPRLISLDLIFLGPVHTRPSPFSTFPPLFRLPSFVLRSFLGRLIGTLCTLCYSLRFLFLGLYLSGQLL